MDHGFETQPVLRGAAGDAAVLATAGFSVADLIAPRQVDTRAWSPASSPETGTCPWSRTWSATSRRSASVPRRWASFPFSRTPETYSPNRTGIHAMKPIRLASLTLLAVTMAACSSIPPDHAMLDQARSDFRRAQADQRTQTLAPAGLKQAGQRRRTPDERRVEIVLSDENGVLGSR